MVFLSKNRAHGFRKPTSPNTASGFTRHLMKDDTHPFAWLRLKRESIVSSPNNIQQGMIQLQKAVFSRRLNHAHLSIQPIDPNQK